MSRRREAPIPYEQNNLDSSLFDADDFAVVVSANDEAQNRTRPDPIEDPMPVEAPMPLTPRDSPEATDWIRHDIAPRYAAVTAPSRLTSRQTLQSFVRRQTRATRSVGRLTRFVEITFRPMNLDLNEETAGGFIDATVSGYLHKNMDDAYPHSVTAPVYTYDVGVFRYTWTLTTDVPPRVIGDALAGWLRAMATEDATLEESFVVEINVRSGNRSRPVLRQFPAWPMSATVIDVGGVNAQVVQLYLEKASPIAKSRVKIGKEEACLNALVDSLDSVLTETRKGVAHSYRESTHDRDLHTWILRERVTQAELDIYVARLKRDNQCPGTQYVNYKVTLTSPGMKATTFFYPQNTWKKRPR